MNNIIRKPRPGNIIRLFLGLIPIILLTITFSCEEDPSSLGSEILPDSDKLKIHYDTSLTFTGNVIETEPFITFNLDKYSIGAIENEYFGKFKGEFLTQFIPLVNDSSFLNNYIDSAFLFLEIDSVYGNLSSNVSFDIFELTSEIDDNGSYMSDSEISGFFTTTNRINGATILKGDTLVKIPLNYSFISKLTSVEDSIYRSAEYFKSIFNGLVIIPNSLASAECVLFADISSSNSNITLYYNDSLSFKYLFKGNRFAKYTNDYSGSIVNDYLTNPENDNDDLLFLQGINGVSSKITFSNLDSWFVEDSSYSVLNAEIIIPVFEDDNFELFFPPKRLFLEYADTDSSLNVILDYAFFNDSRNLFDGYYDSENHYYHFNISKHFMSILKGNIKDHSLNFNIVSKSFFPHRVILQSADNIKLSVTYTKH